MKVSVIGAGDVVANRLVPALIRSSFALTPSDIQVYALDSQDSLGDSLRGLGVAARFVGTAAPDRDQLVAELVGAGRPTFVATPPDAHLGYYAALSASSIRCAVEKPLSIVPDEIAAFEAEARSGAPHLFALSYYALEKALPVTYLLSPADRFGHFLEWVQADGRTVLATEKARAADWLGRLGELRELRVDLLEGVDRSPRGRQRLWTESAAGLAYETLIHPLIIARNFLVKAGGRLGVFAPHATVGTCANAAVPGAVTFARLDGTVDHVALTLSCGKYMHPTVQRRRGVATYAAGRIDFDFDDMSATLTAADGASDTLRVRAPFRYNYGVQVELALAFFERGWASAAHDQREAQLDALRWLLTGRLRSEPAFVYVDGSEPECRGLIGNAEVS